MRGRFEDEDDELEEDEELEEEEEEEEEEMSHFSLRLEGGRPDSEDEEEVCKSCIVRHFYYSNRCPKCNIVVHQTQPLYNIRKNELDRQLQDIVYKLVINLEEREKKQMHDFYKERGLEVPKPAVPQPVPSSKGRSKKVLESVFRIPPELDMSLLLEFIGANEGTGHFKPLEKKFVRVSGEATIGHVEKFLRRKMGLDPACQVDIICGDHLLEQYQTLREIRRAIGDAAMQRWSAGPPLWSCGFSSENYLKILAALGGGKRNNEASAGLHFTKDFHTTCNSYHFVLLET
ncbi:polycomb complex protein BMI-1 isoform X1 [Prionailurus iriomotensis]